MKTFVDTREASGWFSWLSIFTSAGALAGVLSQLAWLSEYKLALFVAAGSMLVAAGVLQVRARLAPGPADPTRAAQSERARIVSMRVYRVSVLIFAVGYFFAFIAPALS